MTDAVLRFLVELEDRGLGKLNRELKLVASQGTATAASVSKDGSQATRALNRIAQSEASAAKRSVENAARRHALIRRQINDYQAIARAAVKGSDEEIAANLLAEKAQRRLARETGVAAAETSLAYNRAGASARHYERDVTRLGRGILSGSGLLRGATRAIAFGSTTFLGGVGATFALRSIIEESAKAQSVQKREQAQLAASGISYRKYGAEIDAVVAKKAHLAGVDEKDVKSGLTDLIRTTGSVAAGEKLLQSALDVSAGKHIALTAAAGLEARVFSGNLGILKRYGIVLSSNVKTPLEALIALQAKFAGQAEAAGETTAGAFGRAENSLHVFEEGLGAGILPVLRDRLNALTGALDDEDLKRKAEELGRTIATNLDGAITTVVHDVRQNWPEIKRDFEDVKTVVKGTADVAEKLAHWLGVIGKIVPDKGSLIEGLLLYKGAKRILFGKAGAKTAAAAAEGGGGGGAIGVAESVLGGIGLGAFAKKIPTARVIGGRLVLPVTAAVLTYEVDRAMARDARKSPGGKEPGRSFWSHIPLPTPSGVYYPFGKSPDDKAQGNDKALQEGIRDVRELGRAHKLAAAEAAAGWNSVKDALKATGAGLDAQKTKLEQIVKEQQAAARAAAQSLDEAFGRLQSDVDSAFDAQTQRMLDNISYRVRVVGQGIHEAFTLRGDEQTPAERELAALDKLGERRNYKRNIYDAQQNLATALQIGDPVKIQEAERQLQDAQTEKRRYGLERRAELERKAADKAKANAEKQLQARRDLEKRQLDDQLAALLKRAENGKLGGEAAVKAVLGVLNKHGLDFKKAGALLGTAFSTELKQDLDLVRGRADKVAEAFDRIGNTKAKIHALAGEVARLAAELARVQRAGAKVPTLGLRHEPGGVHGGPHADGGVVAGPAGRDVIHTMLTRDELVLNEDQQKGLKRRLGVSGGPRALFQHIRGLADGGVVGDSNSGGIVRGESLEQWLRKLTRLLARASLRQSRAAHNPRLLGELLGTIKASPAERARARRQLDPVHIESLVGRTLGAGGERRLGRTKLAGLEQRLAQEQAHPFDERLLRARPTGTSLGAAARTGQALPDRRVADVPHRGALFAEVHVDLDGHEIAKSTRRVRLQESERGYVRRRGPHAGRS